MTTTGWGGASWGGSAWGDGGVLAFDVASLFPHRDNVLRLGFTSPPRVNGLLNQDDALQPSKYVVTASGIGLDEQPARAVAVSYVVVAEDMVGASAEGSFLDLVLDRPMSPWPCEYEVTYDNVASADGLTILAGQISTPSTFRYIQQPDLDAVAPNGDLANPQTAADGDATLGSYTADESGDLASDSNPGSLKKRVIRIMVTEKNSFAHLPGFGAGIPQEAKRLLRAGVLQVKAADVEAQVRREPDVLDAKVTTRVVHASGGTIVWFMVAVTPVAGKRRTLAVPFPV